MVQRSSIGRPPTAWTQCRFIERLTDEVAAFRNDSVTIHHLASVVRLAREQRYLFSLDVHEMIDCEVEDRTDRVIEWGER